MVSQVSLINVAVGEHDSHIPSKAKVSQCGGQTLSWPPRTLSPGKCTSVEPPSFECQWGLQLASIQ